MGIKSRDLTKQANLWVNFAKETAHQLGTPLSSLYGWLEMLKMKLFSGHEDEIEKVKYVLDEAIEDVKRLNKRVFRFSQIGSEPELAPVDLNEIVRETVAYFRDRIPRAERTIQLVANYDRLPLMMLNRDLMGWVVENLLKNSMDAIQKKEGIIQIETSFLVKENKVRITHMDNGSGIKKENVSKIFNAGFSTKKHGWGLGLALAKRIVTDYHFGSIYVESTQVDRGTTFFIDLPVRPVPGDEGISGNG
jgi:signal transduction histidine kinase